MTRDADSERRAEAAATYLRSLFKIKDVPVGLVLGTGWGDTLPLYKKHAVPFSDIPGFEQVAHLEGHAREVVYGLLQGPNGDMHHVIALRGRMHLNERTSDPKLDAMVRLQVEMLLQLGVKTLVLTCAAGSLQPEVKVGQVVLMDGFVTLFAPPMPMFAGEFRSPEDTIDRELMKELYAKHHGPLRLTRGGHVMLRGPFFEGRAYDKMILRNLDPDGRIVSVGMSVLPEACIAALYDAKTVPIAFITNNDSEEHSHEENQKRAKEQSTHLGDLLSEIVSLIGARASTP